MSVALAQEQIDKLNLELDNLEKKLAKETDKEADKVKRINEIRKSTSEETPSLLVASKMRLVEKFEKDLETIKSNKAGLKKEIYELKRQGAVSNSKITKDLQPQKEKGPSNYITGFDGIRALSVIAVIFYHLTPGFMKGGYLGVPVFLVLSGFLITDKMMKEWNSTGKISIRNFYDRRLRRIYPALVTVLVLSSAYITLFQRELLYNLHQIVGSSLVFVNNWWQIAKGFSYFDRFSSESPFTHIWSLAVEGQAYIIAPLMLIFLLLVFKKPTRIAFVFLILSVASAIWMAVLFDPGTDPTRVYYGTDTRIFSIWFGAALAIIMAKLHFKRELSPQSLRRVDLLGLIAWVVIFISFIFLETHYTFVYYGGIALISLLGAAIIAITLVPGSKWNMLLSNPVFSWIGKRSYGIYLYQFPVMIFYEAKVGVFPETPILHIIIKLCIIGIVSELSYRFIEIPLQKFDYKSLPAKFNEIIKAKRIPLGICTAFVLVAVVGICIAPTIQKSEDQVQLEAIIAKNQELVAEQSDTFLDKKATLVKENIAAVDFRAQEEQRRLDEEKFAPMAEIYNLSVAQLKQASEMPISVIGDSIMITVLDDFQKVFPLGIVDAAVSRQCIKGPEVIRDMEASGQLKDTVIMELGVNGVTAYSVFEEIMTLLEGKTVYWVNGRDPKNWELEFNALLLELEKQYSNLTIIDWYSFSYNHPEWYYKDLVHPNLDGAKQYVHMLGDAILKDEPLVKVEVVE